MSLALQVFEGSPVGDGWQPTRDLTPESLTVLKCHRARKVSLEFIMGLFLL